MLCHYTAFHIFVTRAFRTNFLQELPEPSLGLHTISIWGSVGGSGGGPGGEEGGMW